MASGVSGFWNNINNWNHISLVFDRDQGTIHRYVNGVHYDSLTMTSPAGTLTGTQLLFGAGRSVSEFFSGKLDDIRIYNRALSVAEIRDLAGP